MTLADLAQRTDIPTRLLRYVLEHEVLPAGKISTPGRGAARDFTPFEAFAIAFAALLLNAGLRRQVVQQIVAILSPQIRNFEHIPLYQAFMAGKAKLEVGDGQNIRFDGISQTDRPNFDGRWRQLATGATLDASYDPVVTLRIDVGSLSGAFAPLDPLRLTRVA